MGWATHERSKPRISKTVICQCLLRGGFGRFYLLRQQNWKEREYFKSSFTEKVKLKFILVKGA